MRSRSSAPGVSAPARVLDPHRPFPRQQPVGVDPRPNERRPKGDPRLVTPLLISLVGTHVVATLYAKIGLAKAEIRPGCLHPSANLLPFSGRFDNSGSVNESVNESVNLGSVVDTFITR
jgi:hypothetical protein